ncbi:unnamed protein product [Phytophthora fragariaefolia]|uniref:Unnamed protein product n=1 Tax=Phytophthora fragariaefolia TaxID=1490495 RepID=A0A9W6WRF9_9STRA|nr:unnamed protein product [Phytophthora fragariaefolia]
MAQEAVEVPGEDGCPASGAEFNGTSDSEGTESREAKLIEEAGGSHEDSGNSGEILEDQNPVIVLDEDSDSDGEAFYDAISFDGDGGGEDFQEAVKAEPQMGRAQVDFCSRSDDRKRSMSGVCR